MGVFCFGSSFVFWGGLGFFGLFFFFCVAFEADRTILRAFACFEAGYEMGLLLFGCLFACLKMGGLQAFGFPFFLFSLYFLGCFSLLLSFGWVGVIFVIGRSFSGICMFC